MLNFACNEMQFSDIVKINST